MAAIGGWIIGFPALLFSVALIGGLVLWIVVFLGRPLDPRRILPSYLFTTALFVVHVGEEQAAHMELVLSKISGFPVSQSSFLTIAAFVAPTIWILGGALIAAGKPFGRFIMSTFYFGMIVGEPTHFLFPFMTDGHFHYSAGMVTVVPLVLSALYAFWVAMRP